MNTLTIPTTTEVLHGHTVLGAFAHPDDLLIAGPLMHGRAAEADPHSQTHAFVAGVGEVTTLNHYAISRPDFVREGLRSTEALSIAKHLGFDSVQQWAYKDRALNQREIELAYRIMRTALNMGATALVSIGGVGDHPDHLAIGRATDAAAELLSHFNPQTLVLQLYDRRADIPSIDVSLAPATPESIRFTLTAATHNGSQHQIVRADSVPQQPTGWKATPDGEFWADPATIADLAQYPTWENGRYTFRTVVAAPSTANR